MTLSWKAVDWKVLTSTDSPESASKFPTLSAMASRWAGLARLEAMVTRSGSSRLLPHPARPGSASSAPAPAIPRSRVRRRGPGGPTGLWCIGGSSEQV